MAVILPEPSRTFAEFLLLPNLTTKDLRPDRINTRTPLVRHRVGEAPPLSINIPLTSAIMQAVSDDRVGIALARMGGLSFIFHSQPIASQCEMIRKVRRFKAGFVESDTNLAPTATLADAQRLADQTGHTTIPVTDDGSPTGKLVGLHTKHHFRRGRTALDTPITKLMTPIDALVTAPNGTTIDKAGDIIWDNQVESLPIVSDDGRLVALVFRRDFDSMEANPNQLVDENRRLMVGAGVNTHDYRERIPAVVEAGANVLCIDSSDGWSEWQRDVLEFVRSEYGDSVRIGAGNVVDKDGFRYLADHGADFIKVGIGGGSICITREQKGIGRGQASSVFDVAQARDAYAKETGVYVPICSDGGITQDYHILIALALGADFVMMGRYFARFEESPGTKLRQGSRVVKEYWAEGSNRARNWARYDLGSGKRRLSFEEGVESYVPFAGRLKDTVGVTLAKLRSTMCNCGSQDLATLRERARLTVVSPTSIVEGGAHSVTLVPNED